MMMNTRSIIDGGRLESVPFPSKISEPKPDSVLFSLINGIDVDKIGAGLIVDVCCETECMRLNIRFQVFFYDSKEYLL